MAADAGSGKAVCLAVPGELATATGGYIYDRRMLAELAALGWQTGSLALDRSFPEPTAAALEQARAGFDAIPDGHRVVIDGLALAGLLPLLPGIVRRLDTTALIHHPLADETGIGSERAGALAAAERAALALVPRVIVTSAWTRRRLADYGLDPARVAVVEPGVDANAPAPRASGTARHLLAVGTLIPRKGHAVLIDALAGLTALDWQLRCIGSRERDREHAAALDARILEAGLAARIELAGELSRADLLRAYAAADLFVLPSLLEGYGMAFTEAIAHGLPVVGTTAGAVPETVPAAAARLVPPGDVAALRAVLGELLTDTSAFAALSRAARAAARELPGWPQSARRFAACLAGDLGR